MLRETHLMSLRKPRPDRRRRMNDPAATLALCSWLKKRVSEWETEAKAALELETGERKAAKVNGAVIAYTNKIRGRRRVKISSEEGFRDWVSNRWPDEIRTESTVNAAFREKLEKQALIVGTLIDGDGEVCPWAEVVDGEPFLSTKLTEDAGIAISALLQSGRIGIDGIRALEAS